MRVLTAWLIALALALAPAAQPPIQPRATRLYAGVTYVVLSIASPRAARVHVVRLEMQTPGLRVALSPGAGSREVVREPTLAFVERAGAVVAINAHFFWPWPSEDRESEVLGFAASDGLVFSGFERPVQSYAILADAPAFNIDRRNQVTVVHRDPSSPDGRRVREPVEVWTALAGSAQIVTAGELTVPRYRDERHPQGQLDAGGPGDYSNAKSWYDAVNARTAIGVSRDGRTLTLVVVDARGGSAGLSVTELARLMADELGVWHALNLDGGGSSTLVLRDQVTGVARVANSPADPAGGRAVGTSLAVFAPATARALAAAPARSRPRG